MATIEAGLDVQQALSKRFLAEAMHQTHGDQAQIGPIPLNHINILPQPRQTFDDIDILANNIAELGLLEPPIVLRFRSEECCRYLRVINRMWGTEFDITKLTKTVMDSEEFTHILAAGERRTRAIRYLRDTGCDQCHELGKPCGCFEHRFPGGLVYVSLITDATPERAFNVQMSENTYKPVPAHEEAAHYDRLFAMRRALDPSYPLAKFAREMGRSPETISKALHFAKLPEDIQKMVKDGQISYGIACQVSRLKAEGISEDILREWTTRGIVSEARVKVSEFTNQVSEFLQQLQSGQQSLFDIFQDEKDRAVLKPTFRLVVQRHLVASVWTYINWMDGTLNLYDEKKLGVEDAPFSDGSVLHVLSRLNVLLDRLLPHVAQTHPRTKWIRQAQENQEQLAAILSEASVAAG